MASYLAVWTENELRFIIVWLSATYLRGFCLGVQFDVHFSPNTDNQELSFPLSTLSLLRGSDRKSIPPATRSFSVNIKLQFRLWGTNWVKLRPMPVLAVVVAHLSA